MILLIDNYDSFTYNLYQYLVELKVEVKVYRNDAITAAEAFAMSPAAIVISPGPGRPADAGISIALVKQAPDNLPILGVCLGHQVIGEVFGAQVIFAQKLMHGKTSQIRHDSKTLFTNMPESLTVMRYHSLTLDKNSIPDIFEVSAVNRGDDEVMGIRHKTRPLEGVQFHPESVMTECGRDLLDNFLKHYLGGV